jgi:8-oxo-dGTP pyrophosphatase MutT (NUDIX family)
MNKLNLKLVVSYPIPIEEGPVYSVGENAKYGRYPLGFERKEHQMIVDTFEENGSKFVGNADTNLPHFHHGGYAYPFNLVNEEDKIVMEQDVIPQYTVKNVVTVLYYKEVNKVNKLAIHFHHEDDIFGYPQEFWSTPAGRIDEGRSTLSNALIEAYEETGGQCPVNNGDIVRGYIKKGVIIYIFIEVFNQIKEFDNSKNDGTMTSKSFFPFNLKLDGEKYLFPRPIGMFDAQKGHMHEISFDSGTILKDNPEEGRFGCFKYGEPIHEGLEYFLQNTEKREDIQKIIICGGVGKTTLEQLLIKFGVDPKLIECTNEKLVSGYHDNTYVVKLE